MLPYLNTLQVALNDSGYVALAAGDYKVGSATVEKCKWYVSKTGLDWMPIIIIGLSTTDTSGKEDIIEMDGERNKLISFS